MCAVGTYLDSTSNKCGDTCPNSTYANDESGSCMKCQPDCIGCIGNNYTCTSCNTQTYLFNNSCVK